MNFGITKETQGGGSVPIPAPIKLKEHTAAYKTGYEFPVVKLVKVHFNPAKEMTSDGVKEEKPVLEFLFKDSKNRQFTHIEFPIKDGADRFSDKMEWLNQRIMHIWEETNGVSNLPEEGIGTNAKSFAEFFEDVAAKFNGVTVTEGEKQRVLYPTVPLYIKLTYNKDRQNLPMFPNFIQRAVVDGKQVPVEKLIINPQYDKIEPSVNTGTANKYSGGTDNTFGGADEDDFPDV